MTAADFTEHRGLLYAVAYRVLGTVADAEDVVQETWLRWSRVDTATVEDPEAYLVKVATRLSIDRLRSAAVRRESYIGPWLPEPMLTTPDAADDVVRVDSVSTAMLLVLEALSPTERAVFVLNEAFGYSLTEIASILGRRDADVRQLAHRARTAVAERRRKYDTDPTTQQQVTERFLEACHTYPKSEADRLHIPRSYMRPFGALLGAGSLGLLAGLAIPPLGVLAASGLVLYFLGALIAHLRVHDHQLAPWSLFFTTSLAALITSVTYH